MDTGTSSLAVSPASCVTMRRRLSDPPSAFDMQCFNFLFQRCIRSQSQALRALCSLRSVESSRPQVLSTLSTLSSIIWTPLSLASTLSSRVSTLLLPRSPTCSRALLNALALSSRSQAFNANIADARSGITPRRQPSLYPRSPLFMCSTTSPLLRSTTPLLILMPFKFTTASSLKSRFSLLDPS